MLEEKAKILIQNYSILLKKNNYEILNFKKALYDYEVDVKENNDKIKLLVYFGKKGIKTVLQGNNESKIYRDVNEIINGSQLFEDNFDELKEPEIYIGTDESGKGDYFGPLVVAGVYVNQNTKAKLKEIGVRDSKDLTDRKIKILSKKIKEIVGDSFDIISISPLKYNELINKFGNLNKLLGWAHAKVLENLLEKSNSPAAISDKFGNESILKNALQDKLKNVELYQFTKAEKYTAVAAASIIARDKLNRWFEIQCKKLEMEIPKGASSKVEETAKKIKKHYGEEELKNYIKFHFKTTKRI